ncbi:hypothetical protein [Fructobacillus cardui]|uniref:Uncharacterized protein n=1 Tax=Fructobacillus cardui TaxID=2893170 RepID=A0ABM9MRH4_9LACO|nr:unnamed protein product [Fructobacillus cardui]
MFKKKKILLTMTVVTVVLTLGATTFIVNAVTNPSDQEQGFITKKKSSSAQSPSEKSVSSISQKVQSATGSSSNQGSAISSNTGKQVANSSSSANSNANSASTSSASNSASIPTVSNTLTQDDFRSSDDLAYRMIALYGLAHGDYQWQKLSLMQSKGIILTKVANQSNPTFTAKIVGDTGSDGAYYKYLMNDTSTASQSGTKPMSFSQNNTTNYRASIIDVLNYVNSIGGRSVVQKMKFQLVESSN